MNFTNTDRIRKEVYNYAYIHNPLHSQVSDLVDWQVEKQMKDQVINQIFPVQNTIKQKIRK